MFHTELRELNEAQAKAACWWLGWEARTDYPTPPSRPTRSVKQNNQPWFAATCRVPALLAAPARVQL
jgi:hypothetical protein